MRTFNDPELGGLCLRSPQGLSSRLTHAAAMLNECVTGKVGESPSKVKMSATGWMEIKQKEGGV